MAGAPFIRDLILLKIFFFISFAVSAKLIMSQYICSLFFWNLKFSISILINPDFCGCWIHFQVKTFLFPAQQLFHMTPSF